MMNKLTALFLFILSFSTSCTFGPQQRGDFNETVALESSRPKIEVDVNEVHNDTYGPSLEKAENISMDKQKMQRKAVICFDLVPSLYASLSYISLFKELEKKEIYPNIINTSGFSAIIAALYGKYRNANKLEWKVFALLRNLKDKKIYSESWYNQIENFLQEEFKRTRLEQLSLLVTISSGQKNNPLVSSGEVVSTVMESLKISRPESFLNRPSWDYREKLQDLGTDLYFLINAFPEQFKFQTPNGFVWGVYTKVSGFYRDVDSNNFIIKSEIKFLDTLPNLSDLLISSHTDVSVIVDKISEDIEKWINKNN